MSVVGISVGRLRTGFTLLHSAQARRSDGASISSSGCSPVLRSHLFTHGKISPGDLPESILDSISTELSRIHLSLNLTGVGMFSRRSAEVGSTLIERSELESLKLQAVLSHEIRKRFSIDVCEVGTSSVRKVLDISAQTPAESRHALIDLFKKTVPDRSECSTTSGFQVMAESWGVAKVLSRQMVLVDLRRDDPTYVDRIRETVKQRRVFSPSATDKLRPSVVADLIEAEVEKILVKRFSL